MSKMQQQVEDMNQMECIIHNSNITCSRKIYDLIEGCSLATFDIWRIMFLWRRSCATALLMNKRLKYLQFVPGISNSNLLFVSANRLIYSLTTKQACDSTDTGTDKPFATMQVQNKSHSKWKGKTSRTAPETICSVYACARCRNTRGTAADASETTEIQAHW